VLTFLSSLLTTTASAIKEYPDAVVDEGVDFREESTGVIEGQFDDLIDETKEDISDFAKEEIKKEIKRTVGEAGETARKAIGNLAIAGVLISATAGLTAIVYNTIKIRKEVKSGKTKNRRK
jgi:hypothetical protein